MKTSSVTAVVMILALVTLIGLIYWIDIYKRDLVITIVFDSANGIEMGSKVVLGDFPVGEVIALKVVNGGEILVDVRIHKEYKHKINSSSVFIIESYSLVAGAGKRQISVEILKEDAPSFTQGARVEGYSSKAQFFMHTGKKILESAYQEFDDWIREFKTGLEQYKEDERLNELKKDVQELMEQTRKSVEKGIAELNKEIPRLKEELNRIIEELRKLGKNREGQEFRDTFDRYLERLEQEIREARIKSSSVFLRA